MSSSGLITGTPGSGDVSGSPYAIAVTASDGANSAVATFSWSIATGGPVLANPGSQTFAAGSSVLLPLWSADTDGGTPAFTESGLPAGLFLNPATGTIFGIPAADAVSTTAYTVTVTSRDATASATQTFDLTIVNAWDDSTSWDGSPEPSSPPRSS